jgi:predicted metal-dependent hydrolase
MVTSPAFVEDSDMHEVVYKRADCILSKLKLISDMNRSVFDRRYSRGDNIVYLGEEYKLKVIEEVEVDGRIRLKGREFNVNVSPEWNENEREKFIRDGLAEWYKHEAFKQFKERTRFYSEVLKLYPNNIRVKEQKSIWGSCSTKNNINFNWKLIMSPQAVLDYIVVHELCHLKHRDHSKNFWDLVELIIPDYKEKKKWLKENGRSLRL